MGEVWLARDRKLNRQVALKVLPPDLTQDPSRVARFQQEARAASALNHPNVCTIHALGETTDGQQFIAMEFVEGETLRQRLAGRAVTLREALDLAIQVASALSAAHAAGVVHRDVKPENVMLRPDGLVKVLDFGLAKLAPLGSERADAHTTHAVVRTDAGTVVGTVDYMSPEQARGQAVDARTDVWSLGVLMYELVAGRRPFAGQSSSEVLAGILEHDPAPLARFDPDAPSELQRIVGKALRKDREQRYQVMKDLLLDLQALRDDVAGQTRSGRVEDSRAASLATPTPPPAPASTGVTPRPQSSAEYVVTGIARHKVSAALVACVVALIVGGAWWVMRIGPIWSRAVPSRRSLSSETLTRLTFESGLQTDATWSPDGRLIAYAADKAGNFDIWVQPVAGGEAVQAHQVARARYAAALVPRWAAPSSSAPSATGAACSLVPALGGPERQLTSFGVYPQWSSEGSEILFADVHAKALARAPARLYAQSPRKAHRARSWRTSFEAVSGPGSHVIPTDASRPWDSSRSSVSGSSRIARDGPRMTKSTSRRRIPLNRRRRNTLCVGGFSGTHGQRALRPDRIQGDLQPLEIAVDPNTLHWVSAERLTTGPGPDVSAALSRDGTRLAFTTEHGSTRLWVFPFDPVARRLGSGRPLTEDDAMAKNSALSPDGHLSRTT